MNELANSNIVAKQYAKRCYMKYRQFRSAINNFIKKKHLDDTIYYFIQDIPPDDLKSIMWVEHNKNTLNQSFINQAAKIAIRLSQRYGINSEDIIGESKVFLQLALYGYTNSAVKLTTYVHSVVSRELTRHILFQHIGISGNSSDLLDIKRDYFHAESCLVLQGITPSYHNILEHLQYNKEDAQKLMGVMAHIVGTNDETEQINHKQSYFYEDGLAKMGLDVLHKEQEVNEAKETCDYIFNNLLSQEEKSIFLLWRQNMSVSAIAQHTGAGHNVVRRIINNIKNRVKSHFAKEAA